MTTNKPTWLTAWLYAYAIWMNIEQGWRMFRWDYKTWLFLMSLDGHASHTAACWWDCLSSNPEPIKPR